MRSTPGVELRSYFGSQAADLDGSLNLAGIKDPAVDALIERVVAAKTREDMTIAARALDRVLRAGHYWVPHWYKGSNTVAYWDKFSRPETKPKYDRGILDTWWFDEAKAAQIETTKPSDAAASVPTGAIDGDPGVRPSRRRFTGYAAVSEPIPDDDGLEYFPENATPRACPSARRRSRAVCRTSVSGAASRSWAGRPRPSMYGCWKWLSSATCEVQRSTSTSVGGR